MKIFRSISAAAHHLNKANTGCVMSIGNFDGVHIGHQAMLAAARERADALQVPLLVLSFDPHPDVWFSPQSVYARLSSLAERALMFKHHGVDLACIVPFNGELANLAHQDFVEQILYSQLRTISLIIGDDFHYGRGRKGDASSLMVASRKYGFDVVQLGSISDESKRVSSTRIRKLLQGGKLDKASRLLGQPYCIVGRVTHGEKRGRSWGFPTLNLPMRHERALKGVFAVRVQGLAGGEYAGVANLGKRPTVGGVKTLLETHLFDYAGDAYGQRICVSFHAQLREEQKFDDFDALKKQIRLDTINAKIYFDNE
jgi:riboflavin kinase/FMN adenylyltransferase